jgi:hypothetical protein
VAKDTEISVRSDEHRELIGEDGFEGFDGGIDEFGGN